MGPIEKAYLDGKVEVTFSEERGIWSVDLSTTDGREIAYWTNRNDEGEEGEDDIEPSNPWEDGFFEPVDPRRAIAGGAFERSVVRYADHLGMKIPRKR